MDALGPDDLWAVISPLLPPEPEKLKGDRPRASDRSALAGITLDLRIGMQWKHMPRNALGCSGKTSWRRLGEWQAAGVWANLHRVLLASSWTPPKTSRSEAAYGVMASWVGEVLRCAVRRGSSTSMSA